MDSPASAMLRHPPMRRLFHLLMSPSCRLVRLILSEKQPVTPETAVKLAAAFGGSAKLWLNMQAAYDLWHAERQVDVSDIPPMRAA